MSRTNLLVRYIEWYTVQWLIYLWGRWAMPRRVQGWGGLGPSRPTETMTQPAGNPGSKLSWQTTLFRHNETTEKVLAKCLVIPWNNFWYFLCSKETLNLCQDKMRLISSSFHVLARLLIFFHIPERDREQKLLYHRDRTFSTIIPSLMSWY